MYGGVDWNQKAKHADPYFLKGVIQNLMKRSGIRNVSLSYEIQQIVYKYKNQPLCIIQTISEKRLNEFDIKQAVFFAAINWNIWIRAANNKVQYMEVPKFPAVQRDLAIVLDKEITYQQVQQATGQLKIEALQDFDLFDVFESDKLGANKKSYALSYTFQLQDRTLTDTEIDQLMQQLMNAYKSKLQAQIRE